VLTPTYLLQEISLVLSLKSLFFSVKGFLRHLDFFVHRSVVKEQQKAPKPASPLEK
jgi:hypothetical protein